MAESTNMTNGIGFVGLLTIVFITLKLIGKIAWSWWWVLAPVWLCALLTIFLLFVALVLAVLKSVLETRDKERRRKHL